MMYKKVLVNLSWKKQDARSKFMAANESGIYTGTDFEGKETIIELSKGHGMKVAQPVHGRRWEVVYYSLSGRQDAVTYKEVSC